MQLKFIGVKINKDRPLIDVQSKRWKKEGNTYKLINPDYEKDKQYFTASLKDVTGEKTKQFDPSQDKLYIAGVANANIVDRMQERLEPRGLDVSDFMKNMQLLAHHDYRSPIGSIDELDIQEDGIHFIGWIGDPSKGLLTEAQKEIRSLVQQGILKTVSVGFIPKKVKAPLFNSEGEMEEPAVIEKWELLEISVVSVPANQDSVFQMRDYQKENTEANLVEDHKSLVEIESDTKENVEDILSNLAAENTTVQTLIFDKEKFSKEQAQKWAKDHGFRSSGVDESEDSFRIRQRNPEDFDQESFRTIDLTEGVKAVIGKLKTEESGKSEDNKKENFEGEVLTLLRNILETSKRGMELSESLLQKSEEKAEKPKIPEDDEEDKPKPEDDEEEKAKPCEDEEKPKPKKEDESSKASSERLEEIEDKIDKLIQVMGILLEKGN